MATKDQIEELIKAAIVARESAYAPYSHFKVGAALLTETGQIFTGCNIENAACGLSLCAERTAIAKAVSEGWTRFVAIAVIGTKSKMRESEKVCTPCGACRQFLSEFNHHPGIQVIACHASITIPMKKSFDEESRPYSVWTLEELLPNSFGPGSL